MPKIVDHEGRRRDFIEAAYQTILEEGLAKTTIRSVAKRAGYTTGALVHYFKNKEELIGHVLEENGKDVRLRMIQANEEHEGREALRAVLREALPHDNRSAASWRIWLALWYHAEESSEMRAEEQSRYKEWLSRIRDLLAESQQRGELDTSLDIDTEAQSLVALCDGIGVQYLMNRKRMRPKHIDLIVDNYLDRLFVN